MKTMFSTNTLKIWAIVAMVCDHLPYLTESLQAQYYAFPMFFMHGFGRITAPLFFYLLALGYRRTRNANRYTVRLLIFALISYVPYIWYFENARPDIQNFYHLDVVFTMLFGLLLLRSLHEIKRIVPKAVCVILCLIGGYWCDYGLYGLAMILICDLTRDSRRGTILGLWAVIMVYTYLRVTDLFGSETGPLGYLTLLADNPLAGNYVFVLLCQLLPLIFIAGHRVWDAGGIHEAKPGFLAKWCFYIFYPAHITVFLLIRLFALP